MADTPIEKTYSLSYVLGSLLAGLLVGTLIAFAWFSTDPDSKKGITETRNVGSQQTTFSSSEATSTQSTDVPTATNETPTTPTTSTSRLAIDDQSAGLSVTVRHAEVSQDQWVVIHEERDGNPGNVLGAARFLPPGQTSGVVTLLRGTKPGSRYFGVIYQDNGDRVFSMDNDTPLHDAQGNSILVTFTAR